jgi:hypothetical protein
MTTCLRFMNFSQLKNLRGANVNSQLTTCRMSYDSHSFALIYLLFAIAINAIVTKNSIDNRRIHFSYPPQTTHKGAKVAPLYAYPAWLPNPRATWKPPN